jgi:hypothetical protein
MAPIARVRDVMSFSFRWPPGWLPRDAAGGDAHRSAGRSSRRSLAIGILAIASAAAPARADADRRRHIIAMVAFIVSGLAVGHWRKRAQADERTVLCPRRAAIRDRWRSRSQLSDEPNWARPSFRISCLPLS